MNENQEKAIRLWEWVYDNPGSDKEDAYLELDGFEYDVENKMSSTCPACTEAQTRAVKDGCLLVQSHEICQYCPLKGRWPGVRGGMRWEFCYSNDDSGYDVASSRTAFDRWCVATDDFQTYKGSRADKERICVEQAGHILKALREGWK